MFAIIIIKCYPSAYNDGDRHRTLVLDLYDSHILGCQERSAREIVAN